MQSAPSLRLIFCLSPSLVIFIVVSHGLVLLLLPLLALHWAICCLLGLLIGLAAIIVIWQLWRKSRWLLCWQQAAWLVVVEGEAITLQLARPPLLLPFLIILYFKAPLNSAAGLRTLSLAITSDSTDAQSWRQLQRLLRFDAESTSLPGRQPPRH